MLDDAGVAVTVLEVFSENRGRDVWPFVHLLGSGAFDSYDVVGHVHSKRSPHFDLGDLWRDFLWRHLIGAPERMMDAVLARFATEETLGLVMAEDPYIEGWEEDLEGGTRLAAQAGIPLPLPNNFDYRWGRCFGPGPPLWIRFEVCGCRST